MSGQEKEVSSDKLESAIDKAKPYAQKTEKLLKPRMTFLSHTPAKNIIAGYCAIAALGMIPLEALPFAVALPAFALCITALGMANRDGVFHMPEMKNLLDDMGGCRNNILVTRLA